MTASTILCPVCGAATLRAATYADTFKNGTETIRVDGLECYECANCGADPLFEDQIRRNHLRVADAKREAAGLLPGNHIRALREALAISQQEASELFGGGANAFSKYERGDVVQSDAMDRLLKLTGMYPFLLDALRLLNGTTKRAVKGLEFSYSTTTPICMNDIAYQSRTLPGTAQVIRLEDYSPIKSRAA